MAPLPATPTTQPTPTKSLTYAQKWIIGVILVAVVIGGGVFASLSMNPSRTASAPPSWHVVSTFSGGSTSPSSLNTTAFHLGNVSRIKWSYFTTRPETALFSVFVYVQGDPYTPLTQAVCVDTSDPYCIQPSSEQSGTATLNYGPNTFYLQVITDVSSWNMTVEDYY